MKMKSLKPGMALIAALVISACTTSHNHPVTPLQGPAVQVSTTPYTEVLACLANHTRGKGKISIAVGSIPDRTGKFSVYDSGAKVTQGAEDMAISSIGQTNSFIQVERSNLNIPLFELKYANDFLLRDLNPQDNVDNHGKIARAIRPGTFVGSDYVLEGSITEVNYNINTGGFELHIAGIGGGWRTFWFDVALDLRLVNTKTGVIVMTIPMRKQLWGYESEAGVVRFFGNTYVSADAGKVVEEPIGLAVRSVIDSAVIEMTKTLYHLPENTCADLQANVDSTASQPIVQAKK